jgi:hypothetical protein
MRPEIRLHRIEGWKLEDSSRKLERRFGSDVPMKAHGGARKGTGGAVDFRISDLASKSSTPGFSLDLTA